MIIMEDTDDANLTVDSNDTIDDMEVDFADQPRGSDPGSVETWKARFIALEKKMHALMSVTPVRTQQIPQIALQHDGALGLNPASAGVQITSATNSEVGNNLAASPLLRETIQHTETRRDYNLEVLSKPLFQKLVPEEFPGLGAADPIIFTQSLRRLLRLHPLSLREFLILVNMLLTDRAERWLSSV